MRVKPAAVVSVVAIVLVPALAIVFALTFLLRSTNLSTGLGTTPQSPFSDLTYEAALERACAEARVVVLDFRSPVPPGGVKVLSARWSDPQVREWVEREAVAIELDLEREAVRAARLGVQRPTTVVVDAQGRELGRVARGELLQELIYHASREQPLARVAPAYAGDVDDPKGRHRHGEVLREAGFLEEALAEYLWCWDEGLAHKPSYVGVRGSFLLIDLRELARVLPEARAAMETRRLALAVCAQDPGASAVDAGRAATDLATLDERFFGAL